MDGRRQILWRKGGKWEKEKSQDHSSSSSLTVIVFIQSFPSPVPPSLRIPFHPITIDLLLRTRVHSSSQRKLTIKMLSRGREGSNRLL